jgi:hypothetical protein
VVLVHTGYEVPYQLHWLKLQACCELRELELEAGVEDGVDEITVNELELPQFPDVQRGPVTIGISTAPPLFEPWKPKLNEAPGCIILFQAKALAV